MADGTTQLRFTRMPNSLDLRLTGRIAAGAQPENLRLGIDDPAHYAATRLRAMLEARGVRVTGQVGVRHRPAEGGEGEQPTSNAPPPVSTEPELVRLTPPPLAEDLTRINKESQNLHAELMVRRLGLVARLRLDPGRRRGDRRDAPARRRGAHRLGPFGRIGHVDLQPGGAARRRRLAALGRDPALGRGLAGDFPDRRRRRHALRRFRGTPLERRLFAKTGTLNATNALSGYMIARSGRTLIFSFFANDVPGGGSATATMDAVLATIAEAN